MKYLKTHEQNSNEPQVGDYVLMGPERWLSTDHFNKNMDYENFIKNNVGQITGLSTYLISVKYINIPIKLIKLKFFEWDSLEQEYIHTFNKKKLLVFSNTPDDLQLKLVAKKYNL
jgi:hypothetical protein